MFIHGDLIVVFVKLYFRYAFITFALYVKDVVLASRVFRCFFSCCFFPQIFFKKLVYFKLKHLKL